MSILFRSIFCLTMAVVSALYAEDDRHEAFARDIVRVVQEQANAAAPRPLGDEAVRMWHGVAETVAKRCPDLTPEQRARALADLTQYLEIFDGGMFGLVSVEQAEAWSVGLVNAFSYLGSPDFADVPDDELRKIAANSQRYTTEFVKLLSQELAAAHTLKVYKPIVSQLLPAWKAVAIRSSYHTAVPPQELFAEALAAVPSRQRQMMEIAVYSEFCLELAAKHQGCSRLVNNSFFAPYTYKVMDPRKLAIYPANAQATIRAIILPLVKDGVFTFAPLFLPQIGYVHLFVPAPVASPDPVFSEKPEDWVLFPR